MLAALDGVRKGKGKGMSKSKGILCKGDEIVQTILYSTACPRAYLEPKL